MCSGLESFGVTRVHLICLEVMRNCESNVQLTLEMIPSIRFPSSSAVVDLSLYGDVSVYLPSVPWSELMVEWVLRFMLTSQRRICFHLQGEICLLVGYISRIMIRSIGRHFFRNYSRLKSEDFVLTFAKPGPKSNRPPLPRAQKANSRHSDSKCRWKIRNLSEGMVQNRPTHY